MTTTNYDETTMCNLPDHLTEQFDGMVYDRLSSVGYDQKPSTTISEFGWWQLTWAEVKNEIALMRAHLES